MNNIDKAIIKYKNLSFDKKTKRFIVRCPTGKSICFRTLKSAIRQAQTSSINYIVPIIITANEIILTPKPNTFSRRASTEHNSRTIDKFCSDMNKLPIVKVSGKYEETHTNVYKQMSYIVNDVKTDFSGLVSATAIYGIYLQKEEDIMKKILFLKKNIKEYWPYRNKSTELPIGYKIIRNIIINYIRLIREIAKVLKTNKN